MDEGALEVILALVSLVAVLGGNWCYSCGTVEGVEGCEIVEIANIHAVFMHVAEKMVGYEKRLGEYPTLSAICIDFERTVIPWQEDVSDEPILESKKLM